MKYVMLVMMAFWMTACATTRSEEQFNYVNHEALGEDFVKEKAKVCEHFSSSNDPMILKKYHTTFWEEKGNDEYESKMKKAQFEVSLANLPAWHCGETSWAINQNLRKEKALGRDVPLE